MEPPAPSAPMVRPISSPMGMARASIRRRRYCREGSCNCPRRLALAGDQRQPRRGGLLGEGVVDGHHLHTVGRKDGRRDRGTVAGGTVHPYLTGWHLSDAAEQLVDGD